MSPMFVIGVIAYLAADGSVDDFQFGKFHDVATCNAQSERAIEAFKLANPAVAKDNAPILCWDTRDLKNAPKKPQRSPGSVDL